MSESKTININESLIIRDEDIALFSLQKMQVYKFTEVGFEIIKYIKDHTADIYEIKAYCNKEFNMKEDEVDLFINKLLLSNLIEIS